jgi:hypothetical protein
LEGGEMWGKDFFPMKVAPLKLKLASTSCPPQGCQIFLGKTYQNVEKLPNCNKTILSGCKIFQMATKYTNIFYFKGPPTYAKIWFFGLEMYHLATLVLFKTFF